MFSFKKISIFSPDKIMVRQWPRKEFFLMLYRSLLEKYLVEILLQGMLDPFAKVLSYAIQNSTIKYSYLTDLCYLCHRAFTRDRDKHFFGRTIVFELIQAIKFKTTIPDSNFLLLLHFVLQVRGKVVKK